MLTFGYTKTHVLFFFFFFFFFPFASSLLVATDGEVGAEDGGSKSFSDAKLRSAAPFWNSAECDIGGRSSGPMSTTSSPR